MMAFCSIHSILCGEHMERLDRHLTSEGCNTLSMTKTSGKAWCAPYHKNTIIFIIVPTFNVTPNNFYVVKATHSKRCILEDLYSYYYYYYYFFIIVTIIFFNFIIITITCCCCCTTN